MPITSCLLLTDPLSTPGKRQVAAIIGPFESPLQAEQFGYENLDHDGRAGGGR